MTTGSGTMPLSVLLTIVSLVFVLGPNPGRFDDMTVGLDVITHLLRPAAAIAAGIREVRSAGARSRRARRWGIYGAVGLATLTLFATLVFLVATGGNL